MKVLQIEVRRLTLFGCSLKTLADVQCTSTRKRGQLPISPIWRRRSTNVKKSTAFCTSLRFALRSTVCILPLVRSLRFTLSNGFSIVCLAPLFSCISLFFSCSTLLLLNHVCALILSSLCFSYAFFYCNLQRLFCLFSYLKRWFIAVKKKIQIQIYLRCPFRTFRNAP